MGHATSRWWDGRQWTGHVSSPVLPARPVLDLPGEESAARGGRWAGWLIAGGQILSTPVLALLGRETRDMLTSLSENGDAGTFPGLSPTAMALSLVISPLTLAGLALLVIWSHRAVSNGAALGLRGERDPTLAAVSWFIPVVSLWWPYESLRECVPPDAPLRGRILRWWVLYVLGGFLGMITAAVAVFSVRAFAVAAVLRVGAALLLPSETSGVVDGVLGAHRTLAGGEEGARA